MSQAQLSIAPAMSVSSRKAAQILASARTLFIENGFGATSMEAVAQHAKVGKATVYAHYSSKDELFAAVIAAEGAVNSLDLNSDPAASPAIVLRRFGKQAMALLLAPSNIAVRRMISAEATRIPELGRLYFESGPSALIDGLAAYLGQIMDKGQMRREDPRFAAAQYLGMIVGDLQLRAMIGVKDSGSEAHRKAVLESGIAAFFRAYDVEE